MATRHKLSATATAIRLLLTCISVARLCTIDASASEVCRFGGTTDGAGHVAITTDVAAMNGVMRIEVAMRFETTGMFWLPIRYLVDEISTWRMGEMEGVAVNTRYLVGDHIVRQQWDTFQRGPDGLQAHRVQAKSLADFRHRHPGFVQHWDPATFGSPWLQDYQSAASERRADLDLKASPLPSGLRPPLAMAFYWVRWLQHDALSKRPASSATALTSSDGHLLQLAFEVHGSFGSAHATIRQQGCEGTPVMPAERQR
jgi:hypothetical protein